MHQTSSVDVVMVLEGEVWLELEQGGGERLLGAGDIVVQNGTAHAWHNRSSVPCFALVVVFGAL